MTCGIDQSRSNLAEPGCRTVTFGCHSRGVRPRPAGGPRAPRGRRGRTALRTHRGTPREGSDMSATYRAGEREQPGRIMSGEMAEQPEVLRRILDREAPESARWPPGSRRRTRALSCSPRAARRTTPRSTPSTCWRSGSACPAAQTSMSTTTACGAAHPTWWPPPGRPVRPARSPWPSPTTRSRPRAGTIAGNTRGPRRQDGTLSPSGTAARSYSAGGVRCPRPGRGAVAVRAESAATSIHSPVRGEWKLCLVHCGLDHSPVSIRWSAAISGPFPLARKGWTFGSEPVRIHRYARTRALHERPRPPAHSPE